MTDQAGMCDVVKEYFKKVFSHDEEFQEESLDGGETVITDE